MSRFCRKHLRKPRPRGALGRSSGGFFMLTDSEIGAIAATSPFGSPPASKYDRLIARAKEVPPATTIVAHPCDETSLRGPVEAAEAGIIVPSRVGPAKKISAVAREHGIDIARFEIVD